MRCAECLELLNASLDSELAPEEAGEVRDHLAQCGECARAFDELAATSRLLREGLVRYPAPGILEARIRGALAEAVADEPRVAVAWSPWLRYAAAGLVIAMASSLATYGVVRERSASRSVRDEILTSHVRSLMPGHLTDVASTNEHNVKPWFAGRVDLSPTVPTLDSAGFILVGGRLDYVGGRTVAVIVYSRRQHLVNVFSWPEAGGGTEAPMVNSQGYHLASWRANGVAFWVASDLNATELSEFVSLFQHLGAAAAR